MNWTSVLCSKGLSPNKLFAPRQWVTLYFTNTRNKSFLLSQHRKTYKILSHLTYDLLTKIFIFLIHVKIFWLSCSYSTLFPRASRILQLSIHREFNFHGNWPGVLCKTSAAIASKTLPHSPHNSRQSCFSHTAAIIVRGQVDAS